MTTTLWLPQAHRLASANTTTASQPTAQLNSANKQTKNQDVAQLKTMHVHVTSTGVPTPPSSLTDKHTASNNANSAA
eukprot:m.1541 g.1541  ORF g.1541 m.1541 type:complete len:77 (+) comp690_c0_seq1:131-361(+)